MNEEVYLVIETADTDWGILDFNREWFENESDAKNYMRMCLADNAYMNLRIETMDRDDFFEHEFEQR
ncbi:hypothetical protein FZC83_01940 [Rossellomorea marisflavi]|uniref:Uncharacterized protein n=1 Tax=Rossellomorea marisflavi TaxID=189381 RepID=A0A5D4S3M2_9BACI|nr:hypothetical protein [Rossellomorea marisflavi]TYS56356.1 hypothetical protein FZC83_01940 [Rossellomorea marisflavi]